MTAPELVNILDETIVCLRSIKDSLVIIAEEFTRFNETYEQVNYEGEEDNDDNGDSDH